MNSDLQNGALAGAVAACDAIGAAMLTRLTSRLGEDSGASGNVLACPVGLALALATVLPWEVRLSGAVTAGAIAAYVPIGMGMSVREVVRRTRGRKGGTGTIPASATASGAPASPGAPVRGPSPRPGRGRGSAVHQPPRTQESVDE